MNLKILILGSSGFVGKNIAECLEGEFTVIKTSRNRAQPGSGFIYFDLFDEESWQDIIDMKPDIVINSAAYGVVKLQQDTS